MPGSKDEIVVTGTKTETENGAAAFYFSRGPGVATTTFSSRREMSTEGEGPEIVVTVVAVRLKKTKASTSDARMQQAAEALVNTVIRVMDALRRANPARVVTVHGKQVSVFQLLQTLLNTEFEVTDETEFGNLGVGTARVGALGAPNIDSINVDAILNNYHNPGFAGDPAFTALILHELAHLSEIGTDFFGRSRTIFQADPTLQGVISIYGTVYGNNLENFANDVATAMAAELDLPIHGSRPGGYTAPSRTPEQIYESNNGTPFPG